MPVLGTLQLSGCNYQIAYDLISQSTANNTSTVSIYGILNVSNSYVAWSSGSAYAHTGSAGLSTRYNRGSYVVVQNNYTFTHNNDGNLTLTLGYGINTTYTSGNGAVNLTLPQIKRYATITATPSSLTDEDDPYITFNNPANATNLNVWLEVNPVGTHYAERTLDITSGTYTWELTNEEREQLRAVIPNSNTGTIRLGLYSTQSGSTGASYKDIPFSIINANPIPATFTITEMNNDITSNNLIAYNTTIINNYSNKKFTITSSNKGIGQKGASIVKYRVSIGDKSIDIPYSATEDVEGIIYNVPIQTRIYQETIDSRGNYSRSVIAGYNQINYSSISLNKDNCSLIRDNGQVGENAKLTLDGYIWNSQFENNITNEIRTLTYKLKKTDSSTWITGTTTITPTLDGNSFSVSNLAIASDNQDGTWDLDDSYDVEITIGDYLSSSTISFILNSAKPTLSLDKKGVGILCSYDDSIGGGLQVNGERIYNKTEVDNLVSGSLKFKAGSVVKRINGDSVVLFTLNELKTLFNISTAGTTNFFALVNNGDGNVNSKHFENCTWVGTTLYVVHDGTVNTDTRINYIIFYVP